MAIVHRGGKLGQAGRRLAKKSTPKKMKSEAGKTLAKHKAKYH